MSKPKEEIDLNINTELSDDDDEFENNSSDDDTSPAKNGSDDEPLFISSPLSVFFDETDIVLDILFLF